MFYKVIRREVISILAIAVLSAPSYGANQHSCSEYKPDLTSIDIHRMEVIEKENRRLERTNPNNLQDIILVDLFKGYFPLPARYTPMGGITDHGPYIRFSSPPLLSVNEKLTKKSFEGLAGTALVGKYLVYLHELEKEKENGKKSTLRTVFECEANGLTVKFRKSPEFPKILNVLIHSEKEYIAITDENPFLWKHLLAIYSTTIKGET